MARLLEIPAGDALVTRDRAIMELLYSSGLRLAELIGLELHGHRLRGPHGAGAGQGQQGPHRARGPQGGRSACAPGCKERGGLAKPDETAFFVGRNGRRLSPRGVQARVAYWARRQGLGQHVHPHLFRHSFASHLLESSGELRGVQELLGHADISTTQIYTHLDFQHLARIYDATHPRRARKH